MTVSCDDLTLCAVVVHHVLRSDSCSYSINIPRNSSPWMFTFLIAYCRSHVLFCFVICLCICLNLVFLIVTVAEGYRGLNSQRGEASSPSGQLQRCQPESKEAPAFLIHRFLAHAGQRPVGGGEQKGWGAGEEGVQGGFPREGAIFQRSFRV